MGGTGKKRELPGKDDRKSDKSSRKSPPATGDDDLEDGDIATPKRDRHGEDDEPLLYLENPASFASNNPGLRLPFEGCHAAVFMDK